MKADISKNTWQEHCTVYGAVLAADTLLGSSKVGCQSVIIGICS